MRGDVLLLVLVLLMVSVVQYSNACSCRGNHPQDQFCKADFVILARVKRERTFNDTRIYKVRVRKMYKMSEKAQVALKSGRLITAVDESMCGVSLDTGKLYAISGKVNSLRAHVSLCGMHTPWKDLTRRQRKGLKAIYRAGCDCNIHYCYGKLSKCNKTPDTCLHTSKCHEKEGICLRQLNKKCMWTRNRALSFCLKPGLEP